MDHQNTLDIILSYLPPRLRLPIERTRLIYEQQLQEITLRADRPLCIYKNHMICYPTQSYDVSETLPRDPLIVTRQEIRDILLRLCDYSVYAHHDELLHGYLSVAGGVRVGICGTAIQNKSGIDGFKHITTLSFRIPREVIGCADEVLHLIDPLRGVLICGAPSSGKTTLTRDMARQLSYCRRVSVVDERGELSAPREALSGYDVGLCDVYVNMPKERAIINSVRSLAPDIIVCDELGDESDMQAIRYAVRCGVSFICTVHASDISDLRNRPVTASLLSGGAFHYLIFLGGRDAPGCVSRIYEWQSEHD